MSRPLPSYEALFENLSSAIILTRDDLNICKINEAAENMLVLSDQLAKKRCLSSCYLYSPEFDRILDEAQSRSHSFSTYSFKLTNLKKECLILDCHVSILGEGYLVFELIESKYRHALEQQAQHEQIQESSRLMLRGLAHEIRNPLASLRGTAQLLQKKNIEGITPYLDILIQEIERLNRLLNNTLANDTAPNFKENTNIHEVLHHVMGLINSVDWPHGFKVEYDLDPSIPEIRADDEQLTQALFNIIQNAIQAMEGFGIITFITRIYTGTTPHSGHSKNVLYLGIQDNGPGISPDMLGKIFVPMVTSKAGGAGLGLYISHNIIQAHGGSIQVESTPGKTRFNIYLPYSA
ncbi:MAG: hypothetical protein D6698_10605 [Gammaproteobacteria bacterium]|nr:MAG: hypothetical protein D6698_10605 [Gammaproteobacteria bacterium]